MAKNKKLTSLLAVAMLLAVMLAAFAACGGTTEYKFIIHPNNGDGDVVWDRTTKIPTFYNDGYSFEGYYLDANLTQEVGVDFLYRMELTSDTDVYLKWTKNSKDGTLGVIHVNNGDDDIYWEVGYSEPIVPELKKPGFVMDGFYADENFTVPVNIKNLGDVVEVWVRWIPCMHSGGTATCTELAICEVCGEAYGELGEHDWESEFTTDFKPTCTESGSQSIHCTRCEATKDETEIPAEGHKFDETKWESDETGHWHPATCGHDVKDGFAEHSGGEATCTDEALCEVCNKPYGEANGHDWDTEWTIDKPATCGENGSKSHHCANCTATKDVTPIEAGHSFDGDGVCTECGYFETGLKFELNADGESWSVTGLGTFEGTELKIPTANYDGKPVTEIGEKAFYKNYTLTSVVIPEGIVSVGDYAFCESKKLSAIQTPESLLDIGFRAFDSTPWYDALPDGMNYLHKVAYVFKGQIPSGTTVEIAEGTLAVADGAFYSSNNDSDLTSITLPEGLVRIGDYAFAYCNNLTSLTIPASVESVGEYLLGNCTAFGGITVDEGNTNFVVKGDGLIEVSTGKLVVGWGSDIPTDGSVTAIGAGAFWKSSIKNVTIPASVTAIGEDAFEDCYNLARVYITDLAKWCAIDFGNKYSNPLHRASVLYVNEICEKELVIPDGVTSISNYAFYGYDWLYELTLLADVTEIGKDTFSECRYLKSIMVAEENQTFVSKEGILYDKADKSIVIVPESITGNVTLLDGLTSIESEAFSGRWNLTGIVIPDSVTSIEKGAFYDCRNLESITVPFVGRYAYSSTEDYEEVFGYIFGYKTTSSASDEISGAVCQYSTASKYYWYYIPSSLKTVEIMGENASIPSYAFKNYTWLTKITIPDNVSSIGNNAFQGCTGLTSIAIPDSVTSIGFEAFRGCTGLASITIPDGVTTIGTCAFEDCTGLTSVTIGNKVKTIGSSAFEGCTSLTSIVIPDSVKEIEDNAFSGCTGLTSIAIGSGLTTIKSNNAFSCSAVLESITVNEANTKYHSSGNCLIETASKTLILGCKNSIIPSDGSVTKIRDYAFYGCTSLASIVIPDCVTSIGDYTFRGCTGLTEIKGPASVVGDVAYQTKPESFTVVITSGTDVGGFSGCTGLTSITLPDGVTSIDAWAFEDCTGLTSITLPDGVTSIGQSAFEGCTGLTSIAIPDSVTEIATDAFEGCTGLTEIKGPASVVGTAAKQAEPESFIVVITSGKTIVSSAFSGCTGLTSVTISDSVTTIGYNAFGECTSLTNVTIPDSVTSIGKWAFKGCSGLTSIKVPDSVTSVGEDAFCCSLTKIEGPASMFTTDLGSFGGDALSVVITSGNSISDKAFYEKKNVISITIPDSVTSIGTAAFTRCTSLTSIKIPDSVTSIGGSAFLDCTGLTSVKIPDSVTSIDTWAFKGCTGLTSVTIGKEVTSIGQSAFEGCTGLTSIVIPDSVTSIGISAFKGCSALKSVTIGKGVTSIGMWAFYDCTGLTTINWNATACTSGGNWNNWQPFYNGTNVTVNIGSNVTSMPAYLFAYCSLEKTNYAGTTDEWLAVEKEKGWDYNMGEYVYCTDGMVAKDGTVTKN